MIPLAFDTETALIAPGLKAPPLVCVSISDGTTHDLLHVSEAKPYVEEMLADPNLLLISHNTAFDMCAIASQWPDLLPAIYAAYEADRVTDTMLREMLQHIAIGCYRGYRKVNGQTIKIAYYLDHCVARRFGVTLEKDKWRLRYGQLLGVPLAHWPQGAKDYALSDAEYHWLLWKDQEEDPELLADEYRQARAAFWIALMSAWGLRTDKARVERYAAQLQTEYDETETKLQEAGLVRDNGVRDIEAAKAYVLATCAKRKVEPNLTDKGNVKLDKDSLDQLGDELLDHYATFSGLKKKIGTDIALLRKGVDTPLQPRFYSLISTGRTSCGDKTDVGNVQNLPRKKGVRECFVPRDGMLYAAADYDGFELRTGAQVCLNIIGRSLLSEALNAGMDPHLQIAATILGLEYETALEMKAAKDPVIDDARQTGKVANFGFPGGLGITRLVYFARKQYNVILTEDEARALKQDWLRAYPEWGDYFQYVGRLVEGAGSRIEHCYTGRYRGDVSYTEACNSFFQGLAADAAKAAGFLISKACYVDTHSPLYGCRIVNFIHDEFILEAPEETAAEAAEELARLMVEGAKPFLPDVPPSAEPYLMRRWSKSAHPIRDNAGRLLPWDES